MSTLSPTVQLRPVPAYPSAEFSSWLNSLASAPETTLRTVPAGPSPSSESGRRHFAVTLRTAGSERCLALGWVERRTTDDQAFTILAHKVATAAVPATAISHRVSHGERSGYRFVAVYQLYSDPDSPDPLLVERVSVVSFDALAGVSTQIELQTMEMNAFEDMAGFAVTIATTPNSDAAR